MTAVTPERGEDADIVLDWLQMAEAQPRVGIGGVLRHPPICQTELDAIRRLAAPSPATDEVVAGLEKVRDQFDMLRKLAAAGVVYEVDRATGKRTRRKLSEVVASECDEGAKFARALLAKLEVRG